jgi:hypothetical protein
LLGKSCFFLRLSNIEVKLSSAHQLWVIYCALSIAFLQAVFFMDAVSAQPAPNQEKDQRTPEQQKIDTQLLYAIYQMRGEAEAKGVPTEPIPLERDAKGRVLVDIRAPVTRKILARIEKLDGTVVSSSDKYHSIIAYLPLGKVEPLARSREVKFIAPKAQSMTN